MTAIVMAIIATAKRGDRIGVGALVDRSGEAVRFKIAVEMGLRVGELGGIILSGEIVEVGSIDGEAI